jgi:hypothetical protein
MEEITQSKWQTQSDESMQVTRKMLDGASRGDRT